MDSPLAMDNTDASGLFFMATRTRQTKKKKKPALIKGRHIKIFAMISVAGALIFLFFSGPRSVVQLYRSQQEKQRLTREIEALEAKKADLDSQRVRLKEDPKYIEKIAREQYNMKKKGEKVYKIVKEPK